MIFYTKETENIEFVARPGEVVVRAATVDPHHGQEVRNENLGLDHHLARGVRLAVVIFRRCEL